MKVADFLRWNLINIITINILDLFSNIWVFYELSKFLICVLRKRVKKMKNYEKGKKIKIIY